MSDAKITLMGLYKIMSYEGKDLFDYLSFPAGIDKDVAVATILQKGSEFEVMYADPEYTRASISYWSKKWFWTFNKWIKAMQEEYDPLHNYDRHEKWTDNNTHSDDDVISSTGSSTDEANGTTTFHDDSTNELTKSAFDSSTYSPYEKTIAQDDSTTGTNTSAAASSKNDETRNNTGQFENVHEGYMYGNIGVTSSQDMLQQEFDVAMFSLYDRIADIFMQEYCIPVYI